MEELINIAFSGMNKRLEIVEEEIKKIYRELEKVSVNLSKNNEDINQLIHIAEMNSVHTDSDEVEVYKFGE